MSDNADITIKDKPTGFLGGGTPVREATIKVNGEEFTGTGPDDPTAVEAARAAQTASQTAQS